MNFTEPDSSKLQAADLNSVREAAARWWVMMHDPPVSAKTSQAFDDWLQADPRHQDAYSEVERILATSSQTSIVRQANLSYSRRRLIKNLALVGGVGVAAAAGVRWTETGHPFADHRTGTGKTKTVSLPDGSVIQLSTRTAIDLHFTADKREVVLHEGEVYCKVAKDPARPFSVVSRFATTTALGTEFSVLAEKDRARVAVTEHSVQLTTHSTTIQIHEGESVSMNEAGVEAPQSLRASTLAWRFGRLEFLSTPLGEVLDAVEQWHRGKILLVGPNLKHLPVTLLIDLNRISEALEKLPIVLPVKVVECSPLLTLIYPV